MVAGFDLADAKVAALAEAAQNEGGLLVTPTTSLKAAAAPEGARAQDPAPRRTQKPSTR